MKRKSILSWKSYRILKDFRFFIGIASYYKISLISGSLSRESSSKHFVWSSRRSRHLESQFRTMPRAYTFDVIPEVIDKNRKTALNILQYISGNCFGKYFMLSEIINIILAITILLISHWNTYYTYIRIRLYLEIKITEVFKTFVFYLCFRSVINFTIQFQYHEYFTCYWCKSIFFPL